MGIPGFQKYVSKKKLFIQQCLENCTLVADGHNLLITLYGCFRFHHSDQSLGGDYASFALFIESYFDAFDKHHVTPVVIMDGSSGDKKFATSLQRHKERLERAKFIYRNGKSTRGTIILPLLCSYLFVQILQKRNIFVFTATNEADDILPTIAKDLNAALLSGDGDFLLEDIPGGVIEPKSLQNCKKGKLKRPHLLCRLYRLSRLLELFPGLNGTLTPIASPLLGNDYVKQNQKVIGKLPKIVKYQPKEKHQNIRTVLSWLATQSSPTSVIENLKRVCGSSNDVISYIEQHFIKQPKTVCQVKPNQSIEEYFKANYGRLFIKPEPGIPKWLLEAGEGGQLKRRMISIFSSQIEFCRPLAEDFSLTNSSYETTFELCDYIYGLLRRSDASPRVVTQIVRVGKKLEEHKRLPKTTIGKERLPMLADIASMDQSNRLTLFYRILSLNADFTDDLKKLFLNSDLKISKQYLTQLETFLISTIYLSQHFSADLSINFLYALLVNILFMGYYSGANALIPKLLELKNVETSKLVAILKKFDKIPSLSSINYQPRIVHQYNAWQNCFNSIALLASILNLSDYFHADALIFGLQGSFIYNLTLELAKQPAPLTYLSSLLGPQAFPLFGSVLRPVLAHSKQSSTNSGN